MISANVFVGLTSENAISKAQESGTDRFRIILGDNSAPSLITCDYNPGRLSLTVEKDVVVSAYYG